jgi:hypothetical protein
MQRSFKIALGVDDPQSEVSRDRGGMATTVLTLQQMGIAFVPFANRARAENSVDSITDVRFARQCAKPFRPEC